MTGNIELDLHRVEAGDLHDVFYIPDFVTEEEEGYLIRQINNAPRPKWKTLANRRLQVWGGDITASRKLLAQPLPPFLNNYPDIIGRLKATGAFSSSKNGQPNHVIVNEYLPKQGIMPHEDGPSYHPVVATISLGSHTVFHYYRYKTDNEGDETRNADSRHGNEGAPGSESGRIIDMSRPVLSLLLEPRSLVITRGKLYTEHLHGISDLSEDVFLPASASPRDHETSGERDVNEAGGVQVANRHMLSDKRICEVVENGGVLVRGDRISLTCRDVEQVVGLKALR